MRGLGLGPHAVALALLACGCSKDLDALRRGRDAGAMDAGSERDAGRDAGRMRDAGPPDAGAPDAGPTDTGPFDAGCTCPTGCEMPTCLALEPSNVPTMIRMDEGTFVVDIDRDSPLKPHWVIFTDEGRITAFPLRNSRADGDPVRDDAMMIGTDILYDQVDRTGGADLAVFRIASLSVPDYGSITAIGNRALVLLVRDEAHVDGTLDVSASIYGPGAAGGFGGGEGSGGTGPGRGGGGLTTGLTAENDRGGGGGGFGSRGGVGGPVAVVGGGGGGDPYGDARLVPLYGGSGGGGGGAPSNGGGTGGGAIQLSAGSAITLGPTARVEAHGAGGGAGRTAGDIDGGAGGGAGSGGGILLEAPRVTIDDLARVGANGGAGGQAANASAGGRGGQNGDSTRQAICPADGAAGPPGGAGSWLDGVAGDGVGGANNGGGGGGGAGRIRINTLAGDEVYGADVFVPSAMSGITTLGTIRLR